MSESFPDRLARAIRRIGKTEAERAQRIGYSVRQVDNWERGEGLAKTLERLETAGVIHITGECPCSRAEPEQATA